MDWWHVAFDIRPSSTESSSTGTKPSSSKQPNSEIFSLDVAASRSPTAKAASSSKASFAAHASDPSTRADPAASTGKSAAASKSGAAAKSSAAAKSAKTASSANPSDGASKDRSAAPDAAAASNSTANNPNANGVGKGRAFARGAAAATSSSEANGPGTADPGTQGNAITDPGADVSNASGLGLLQQLALALEGGDAAAPSTETGTNASTGKAAGSSDTTTSNDANALALAMFAQAFAAGLGTSPAAAQGATTNSSSTSASSTSAASTSASSTSASSTSDRAAGVTDAARSSGGSLQELVSLLAQDIAAGAQGKSDADASRSAVATTPGSPADTRTADSGTVGLNSLTASLAPSLQHLGAASHFSLHAQTGTNTADLKSSVGSTAWTDELGGQLTWMTQRGLESGSLRVSPEHLGPVEVKIAVQNGAASVWFGASHPDTRAALEQALPRLREMFANQGLTLTDSGVSRESPRQSRSSLPQSVAAVSAVGSSDVSVSAAVRLSLGLVDTYA